MPSESKIVKLVNELTKQTINGSVEWEAAYPPPSLTGASDDVIEPYFEASYKDQRIAIFERRKRAYDPEHDTFYWTSSCHLGFVSGISMTWESYEPLSVIWTLMRVANDSASNVDGIIDSLLS